MAAVALLLLGAAAPGADAQNVSRTRNVILVTVDGLRWQEVFTGADSALVRDSRFVEDTAALRAEFWSPDRTARRAALLPFLSSTLATRGQLYGDRRAGSRADVTNPHRFSYPGYSEMLVGRADPRIDSNAMRPNPNRTVLEIANERPELRGRVAAFGSWDVFPFILAEERSGVPVNAGFETATGEGVTERERYLNRLQEQVPSPFASVRLDAFTHNFALEYLERARPRLLYVAYGETDDFAHDGRYDAYLRSARRADAFIREIWEWVQSQPEYRDRTTLLITTDHGRGNGDDWVRHGAAVEGAEAIWIAALGPDSPALGAGGAAGEYRLDQVASTIAALLGFDLAEHGPVGAPLARVLGR